MATKKKSTAPKKKTVTLKIPKGTPKAKMEALVRNQLKQLTTDMVSSVSKVVVECEDKGAKGKGDKGAKGKSDK